MGRFLLLLAFMLPATSARAQSPLDDARLGAAAGELRQLVDGATHAGLPSDLLLDKVREGLAKHVPPPRLTVVVRGLEQALERARAEAQPFAGQSPPRGLLKALVEAHAAGVAANDTTAVLRAGGRDRAIAVLTDLAQRGYPAGAAAHTVAALNGRERALEQLVGQAERLRSLDGASPGDALDAITRANADGSGIGAAERFLHSAAGDDNGRGPNRETSGVRGPSSGGVAPPGHGKGHP